MNYNQVQFLRSLHKADKLHEAPGDVIVKILVNTDGDDVVAVRDDGLVLTDVPFAARMGKSIHIYGVAVRTYSPRRRR